MTSAFVASRTLTKFAIVYVIFWSFGLGMIAGAWSVRVASLVMGGS